MNSAFGVVHGDISKGLPSYLKSISPVVGAETRRIRQGSILRNDYPYLRTKAHLSGKEAARANSAWAKKTQRTNFASQKEVGELEELRRKTTTAGAKGTVARELSRRSLDRPGV